MINKLKNYAICNKKYDNSNSLYQKPGNSNSKYHSNNNSRRKIKNKTNKVKNKNQSQKNIFNPKRSINFIDDVVMTDENTNPNVIK